MEKVQKNDTINEDVIRSLQERLNKMIAEYGSDNLLHPDIIKFSQLLDDYIAEYCLANDQLNL